MGLEPAKLLINFKGYYHIFSLKGVSYFVKSMGGGLLPKCVDYFSRIWSYWILLLEYFRLSEST